LSAAALERCSCLSKSFTATKKVFKDHVTGQYDETIFRFRVPGGWIYTHIVTRFGSVDKNFVADTFVPDSKDWSVDGAVIRNT
jgi:hypothetical protein